MLNHEMPFWIGLAMLIFTAIGIYTFLGWLAVRFRFIRIIFYKRRHGQSWYAPGKVVKKYAERDDAPGNEYDGGCR